MALRIHQPFGDDASYNYAGKKPGDAGYDVNAEIKSGRLAVRSAKDAGTGNQSEAVAYGGYATPEHNTPDTLGGAYELKDANETTRTLIIGQEDESLTVAKKDGSTYEYGMGFLNKTNASKLQMYDSAGGLKTYVGAVEGGAHFMVGDKGSDNKGHLGKMTDQTVFGDAETASITAKKNTYGYARMTARYDRGGYRSGAAIVTNNSDASKFDLEEEKITAVLAENNNSGYLRLSSNNYDGERVWLQAAKNGDGQGNVYLTTGPYSNNYVNMEADRDSGNGYMQFNSGNGSSEIYSKDPSKFSSAYIGRAGTGDESDKVRLLSNGDGETSNSGGHLTLDKGKVIFAANDKSDFTKDGDKFGPVMNLRTGTDSSSGKVAIAAVGNEDQPTAFATTGTSYAAAHAKYTKTEFSNASKAAAVLVSPNGSQNTIAAYADASGKYGDSGTVSVYDPDINAGINFHGHLNSGKSSKTTLYDKNNALAGGGVAVAMKGGQTGTAWLIGQSSNNGGMLQVSTGENNSTNGRVDMYAAGGKGVDMGGTAHMIGGTEHAAIYADYASDGYETSASGMKGHAGNFSNRDVYGKNGTVDGYAMIDIAGGVTADNLNAMDIYTKGDITFTKGDEKGKLYTNVLCIGTNNNSTRNNAGLIDSFGSASVQEDLPQKIKEGKCIPLLPNAKWKDIIYKAAGDIAPLGSYAFRGHEHGGFAKHGHKHPSLIPIKDVQHEKEGKKVGLAEWHETGVTWASKTNAYLVGTVCTKRTNTTSNDGGGGGQPGHRSGDSATVYTGYSSSYTKYCNSASDGISPTNLCTYKISCDQKYFYSSGWTECEASSWNGTCGDNYDGSSRSCTNGTKPVAATATTAAVAGTNAKCKYHPRKWQNYKCTCTAGRTYTKDTTGHYCCNSGTNLKYIYDGRKSYWSSIGRTDP